MGTINAQNSLTWRSLGLATVSAASLLLTNQVASTEQSHAYSASWPRVPGAETTLELHGKHWVVKGANCRPLAEDRCMVRLGDGSSSAIMQREFDVHTQRFVEDGFRLPPARSDVTWLDKDILLVTTDWGPETLTKLGFGYIVKAWTRGQALADAKEIYRGSATDAWVSTGSLEGEDDERVVILQHAHSPLTATYFVVGEQLELERMTLPEKVSLRRIHNGELVFRIDEDWVIAGRCWKAGMVLSAPLTSIGKPTPILRPADLLD